MTTLSKISLNFTDGSFNLSKYSKWLPEPVTVTGAVLVSNGDCSVEVNAMNMSISLQAESMENISKYTNLI